MAGRIGAAPCAQDDPLPAPLAMYPAPGRTEAVPCWLREGFVLVTPTDWPQADAWLSGRMSCEGYRAQPGRFRRHPRAGR